MFVGPFPASAARARVLPEAPKSRLRRPVFQGPNGHMGQNGHVAFHVRCEPPIQAVVELTSSPLGLSVLGAGSGFTKIRAGPDETAGRPACFDGHK